MSTSASAQPYSFELRLIADGDAGAPTGLGTEYDIGDPSAVTATRIGFWLQARVAQEVNQNWGIGRFSRPAISVGTDSFIQVTDSAGGSSLNRGTVDAANTLYGRGQGYRNGQPTSNNTPTGNVGTAIENGRFDGSTRIYGMDAYVGGLRNSTPTANPWGVNGGPAGSPWASDGTFAPWANLYRVWLDITDFTPRTINMEAGGLVNGTVQTQHVGGGFWPMQINLSGSVESTIYSFETVSYSFSFVPTPGAAAMLGLGGLAAMRRRR